jgi:hypothetical protein
MDERTPRPGPAAGRGRRRWPLRLGRGLLVLAGVLAGVVLLIGSLLVGPLPEEEIRDLALAQLEHHTGWRASAGELEIEPLSGLVLRDVALRPPAGFERAPLVIERVGVEHSLAGLLDGRLRVHRLVLERPRLSLRWRDGRSNLELLLAALRRRRAALAVSAPAAEAEPEAGGLEVALDELRVTDLQLELAGPAGVQALLDGVDLHAHGRLGGPAGMRLAAALELPVPAAPNLSWPRAGLRAAVGGRVELDLAGRRLSGTGRLEVARLERSGAAVTDLALEFALERSGAGWRLERLRLLREGRVLLIADARLSGGAESRRIAFDWRWLEFDRALAGPLLGGRAAARLPAGRLRSPQGSLRWSLARGGERRLQAQIELDAVELQAGGLGLEELAGRIDLDARPTAGGGRLRLRGPLRARRLGWGGLAVRGAALQLELAAGLQPAPAGWRLELERAALTGRLSAVRSGRGRLTQARLEAAVAAGCRLTAAGGLDCRKLTLRAGLRGDALRGPAVHLGRPAFALELAAGRLQRPAAGGLQLSSLTARLHGEAGRAAAGPASLLRPAVTLELEGGLGDRRRLAALVRWSSDRVALRPLPALPAGAVLAGLRGRLRSKAVDPRADRLPLALELELERPRVGRGGDRPAWRLPGAVGLRLTGRLAGAERLMIDRLDADLAGLLDLRARGTLRRGPPRMEVDFHTSEHRLEALVAALPADIRAGVPALRGRVALRGRYAGRLAVARDHRRLPFSVELTVDNREVALALPAIGLELAGVSGPVHLRAGPAFDQQVRSRLELEAERLQLGRGGPRIERGRLALSSVLAGQRLRSDGRASAGRVWLPGRWPAPVAGVRVDFTALATGTKDLRLSELRLAAPSLGLTLSGRAALLWTPGSSHWSELRLSASGRAKFASEEAVALPGGLRASGRAGLEITLRTIGSGLLEAGGRLDLAGLDLELPGLAARGMRGGVPVQQRLRVHPHFELLAPAAASGPRRARSSAYAQALRPLGGQRRRFTVTRALLGPLQLEDLSGRLALDRGVLSLGGLRFGLLDGDVVADTAVVLAPADQRRLELDAEMTGVDLSGLGALERRGASAISGNLRLGFDLNARELDAAFNLTRIGRRTLQAMLELADPARTNPGLQRFGRFLQQYRVVPAGVSLDVRRGLLSLRTRLEMGPLARAAAGFVDGFRGDTFSISHVPVGDLLSKYLAF